MKKILIVIDMQNDFISGSLGSKEAQAIVSNVKQKIKEYEYDGDEIIFTRDTHTSQYLQTLEGSYLPVKHCIEGTPGWLICDELNNGVGYPVINKYTFGFDGWIHHDFEERGFDEIEIVGLCTDICVVSNALMLRALFPNLRIRVDAACCAGTSVEAHNAALTVMKSCQIEVHNEKAV